MTNDVARKARPTATRRTIGQKRYTPWLYILPALILVIGIIYVGIGYTGWISTVDWNGIDGSPKAVGFANFAKVFEDSVFWRATFNVAIFGIITIVVEMGLGLLMAILLSSSAVWGKPIYKVIMFLPVVLAPSVVATAFRWILTPDGELNGLLHFLGLSGADAAWLADPRLALYSLAAIDIWKWTGFSFLLYQAGIAQIDPKLFEAAAIDGAGIFKMVWHILIPQLKGTHATLALVGWIGSLKTFDIVYMTTGGGPGRSTEFLTTYIYKQVIKQYHAGYSAALSVVLLVLALLLTTIQVRAYRFGED
jgi:raffinose/stachyose/melibiose transport system permease protein